MADCHPDRKHQAFGLCMQCYQKDRRQKKGDEINAKRRKDPAEYAPNYRVLPVQVARTPDCHPDRKHAARGLCGPCYQRLKRNDALPSERAQCHPDRPHLANGLCVSCYNKQKYAKNAEAERERSRKRGAESRRKIRDELIAAYGGRCACAKCPETNPAFLTLEHVNGDGKKHRKEAGSHTYADLRRRGWPQEGYTLLCWNCNAMTRNGRTCPHEED